MEGKRTIQSIWLCDILSFGGEREKIELQPLNVLIGPNASGKSNLIEVFRLLRALPSNPSQMREGFRTFLDELYQLARQNGFRFHPPVICGSGSHAYRDFKKAVRRSRDALNFLLVDSEKPVPENIGPWAHLNCDSLGLDDSHCHLMAQAMEAWLIADTEALKEVYGKGFNENSLPKNPVEQITVKDLIDSLKKATASTTKGKYHKTKHALEILKKLDVDKVRQAAPYCDRLFKTLAEKMDADS